MRQFATGATRDSDETKPDYEGFFSPLVFESFGKYMTSHRKQADGKLRDSDNWQKGIPLQAYIKSLWRHFVDVWRLHRGLPTKDSQGKVVTLEDSLNAVIFNAQGYLHEYLKARQPELPCPSDQCAIEAYTRKAHELGYDPNLPVPEVDKGTEGRVTHRVTDRRIASKWAKYNGNWKHASTREGESVNHWNVKDGVVLWCDLEGCRPSQRSYDDITRLIDTGTLNTWEDLDACGKGLPTTPNYVLLRDGKAV